eukprot:RCo024018
MSSTKEAVVHPQYPEEYAALTSTQMKAILRDLRENPARKPALVYYCGMKLLRDYPRKLGNEIWTAYEQTLIAALDVHEVEDAEYCLAQLEARFSTSSIRVRRLQGLVLEAQGKLNDANACYDEILTETKNTDAHVQKRKVAVAKALGNTAAAIAQLQQYLGLYQTDTDAHHELAELYVGEGQFARAASCYEELILHEPQNYLFMLKCGEALFSTGEKTALLEARKYFAQSIRLCSSVNNLRAYYALWLTCLALASRHGLKANSENSELLTWASGKIKGLYSSHAAQQLPMATLLLKSAKLA